MFPSHDDLKNPADNFDRRLVDDWKLLFGQNVEIYDRGRLFDRGSVEAVTQDGSILWLKQDGAELRRLVEKLPERIVQVVADSM